MLRIAFVVALSCWLNLTLLGQAYDPLHQPNTYQNADNPHYWKNRPPNKAYWQQDVYYQLKGKIDEQKDIITASEQLVYTNNSPDTLTFVYFHLYQNAFQPNSYYDSKQEVERVDPGYGAYESAGKGTEINSIKVNGQEVKTELDNTILKVWLPTPMQPNTSITFTIDFITYFDLEGQWRRRMKLFQANGSKHFDGVHWYPRIAVYDQKFGWTTDQHIGREFYGNFGAFDVELDFAEYFVVDATGFLLNRDEMLPAELRQKLDISNFKEPGTVHEIIPLNSTKRKVWKFHAENVHDFAFTADPTYRIGEAEWDGIKAYALAREPHAYKWQNAASYTAKTLEVFSEDIGRYNYHKITVADARDGMEYPMITLDGDLDPEYRSLFIHEVGHNWFYGQVGTNETYRASMDEGFTQFLNVWGLEKIDGDTMVLTKPKSKYVQKHASPKLARRVEAYDSYMADAIRGIDARMNTHSDQFDTEIDQNGDGYWMVYSKTAVMLYNLQYVLGDELFLSAMKHYFDQWKFAHPYYEDFRASVINYTKVDLNWFFDQWLETSWSIDYAFKGVRKDKQSDTTDTYIVKFTRKGTMQMPLDFQVTAKDGKKYNYHIPNTWFEKETDATVLPRWIGFEHVRPEYEARIVVPSGIANVQIDTTYRLADVNMLNNSKIFPVERHLDAQIYHSADYRAYQFYLRPEAWWNGFDGAKVGVHLNGNYMKYRHQFDATFWFNSGLGQFLNRARTNEDGVNDTYDDFSFRINYRTPLDRFSKHTFLNLSAKHLDGLRAYQGGISKKSRKGDDEVQVFFKSMQRVNDDDLTYLLFPGEWVARNFNNTINFRWLHEYDYQAGEGQINLGLKSSTIGGDYDYSQLSLEVLNNTYLGPLELRTRTFLQYGTGDNTPRESALFLAGANGEELVENKYNRAVGFYDYNWLGYGADVNHFHAGGGLNLRGYSGYLATETFGVDSIRFAYRGQSGAALNVELDLQGLIGWRPYKLSRYLGLAYYLFSDIGTINFNTPNENLIFGDVRMDAGVGAALTIKKFGPLQTVKPLTIRFDAPLLLNRTPNTSPDFVQFRWVVGVNRAF